MSTDLAHTDALNDDNDIMGSFFEFFKRSERDSKHEDPTEMHESRRKIELMCITGDESFVSNSNRRLISLSAYPENLEKDKPVFYTQASKEAVRNTLFGPKRTLQKRQLRGQIKLVQANEVPTTYDIMSSTDMKDIN